MRHPLFCLAALFSAASRHHVRLTSALAVAAEQYAPSLQPCPSGVALVRNAGTNPQTQTLSIAEGNYVRKRQSNILPGAWLDYYVNVHRETWELLPLYVADILLGSMGFDVLPNVGIATSGGGLRAALFGAGVLNALDGRNQTSAGAGTGGLLQAAQYLSGLSGGSWLVSSLSQADFPLLHDLVFGSGALQAGTGGSQFGGWLMEIDLLQPGTNANSTEVFVESLLEEVSLKFAEGFPVTVSDIWARSLARHYVNGTTASNFYNGDLSHGAGITFSSVPNLSSFQSFAQPFPIILANTITDRPSPSRILNESGVVVPLANPIYEFNVFETGSFDPSLGAFTPTKYLGSPNSSVCAVGFDQIAFIEAASSNLFNTFNTSEAVLAASPIGPIIEGINEVMPQSGIRLDSAQIPNPFIGVAANTFPDTNSALLTLVDGGEDGETTPFQPLLVKARGIDTIIAIDAPADTDDNYADGSSLIATQDRVQALGSAYAFPPVPSTQAEFLAQNLTKRPTFFGCNSSTASGEPLVIYIANGGPPLGQAPVTNTPTMQLSYTADEAQAVLNQVYDIATQGIPVVGANGELQKDPQWPACLACAVVDRKRRSMGMSRASVCLTCFERYCWS